MKEWEIDVPIIGNIYRAAEKIVRYFNGLGVRFSTNGWDSERHWLQRAWTLQEIANENTTINGGIPRDDGQVILNIEGKVSGKVIKLRSALRPVIKLAAQVDSRLGCEVYELAREMNRRYASNPLDKLSGLFYLLGTTHLPCYDAHIPSENVWRRSFYLLPIERAVEILFDFPYRGSDKQWFPCWAQFLDWPERDPEYEHMRSRSSTDSIKKNILLDSPSFFISNIWAIPNIVLSKSPKQNEYKVKINDRFFSFYLPYLSQKPIINTGDQSVFTLAAIDLGHAHNWVVCEAVGKRAGKDVGLVPAKAHLHSDVDGTDVHFKEVAEVNILKKVGVIRTDTCSELMVGGVLGTSLLQKMDCLFV